MTISPMQSRMSLTVAQGIAGFAQGRIATSLARSMQKYRNQMLAISAAMNDRAISQNEIRTRDASVRLAFSIEKQAATDLAFANVSAAAAGVQGRSVDRTLRGLRGSALAAHAARKEQTRQEMSGHANDRINNRVSQIMQTDITVHQKPSLMFAVGGIAKQLFDDKTEDLTPSQKKAVGSGTLIDFFKS